MTVWLAYWAEDERASDPDDKFWRNLYMSGFGGLGAAQGK